MEKQTVLLRVAWGGTNKVNLIKHARQAAGMSVKEAKDWVERFFNPQNYAVSLQIENTDALRALIEVLSTLHLFVEVQQDALDDI